MSDRTLKFLASFFYVGDIPFAPGTAGSFVALLIYVIFQGNVLLYALGFVLITAVGFMVCTDAERIYGQKDPSGVVIDEVAGMLLACFMLPLHMGTLIGAFLLFRIFDIFKVYPMRRLEQMGGGLGIMADDLMAGLYTNIIVHVVIRWVIPL